MHECRSRCKAVTSIPFCTLGREVGPSLDGSARVPTEFIIPEQRDIGDYAQRPQEPRTTKPALKPAGELAEAAAATERRLAALMEAEARGLLPNSNDNLDPSLVAKVRTVFSPAHLF